MQVVANHLMWVLGPEAPLQKVVCALNEQTISTAPDFKEHVPAAQAASTIHSKHSINPVKNASIFAMGQENVLGSVLTERVMVE